MFARPASVVLAPLLLGAVLGCNPYQCVYETRFVSTEPASTPTAAGTFSGWVNIRDFSDGQPVPVSIAWHLQITGSSATITSLTLRDRRDMSQVLATIAVDQSGQAGSSAPPLDTRAERDEAFDTLVSGNGVLVVVTSASSTPVLIDLVVVTREDWHRPSCD
jgi:hypothetical protein